MNFFDTGAHITYLLRTVKYRFKHICEYSLLRAVCAAVRILPERGALWLAAGLSKIIRVILRKRMIEAEKRAREVLGPSRTDQEIRQIVRSSLHTLVLNGIELMRIPQREDSWFDDHIVNPEAIQPLKAHLHSTGRGAILAACHMGNWHLAAVAMNHLLVPIFFLVAHQRNPLTNRFFNQMLAQAGGEGICRETGSMRSIIRNLRSGKVLAITPDVRSKSSAVAVDYLGGQANIPEGMALFARQTDVPIFPCSTVREGLSHHRWTVHQPIFPDHSLPKTTDIQRMTQAVLRTIEADVRAHPEQYFWLNKRWILEPLPARPTATDIPSPEQRQSQTDTGAAQRRRAHADVPIMGLQNITDNI